MNNKKNKEEGRRRSDNNEYHMTNERGISVAHVVQWILMKRKLTI